MRHSIEFRFGAQRSALLVIIISDICGLTLRLSLTRRSRRSRSSWEEQEQEEQEQEDSSLRWSVRSPLHVSLSPPPPSCHGYMQMKREFPKGVENSCVGSLEWVFFPAKSELWH